MSAPQVVLDLVDRFHRQIDAYKSGSYNEIQLRCYIWSAKLPLGILIDFEAFAAAKTAHEKTALQRRIDATDRQIDTLVYELYGLTDDEIKIVGEGR